MEQKNAPKNWNLQITHNGVTLKDTAFTPGDYNILVDESNLQPGYNIFRYVVAEGSKVLAQVSKTFFNEIGGVQKLTELQYEKHHQDWGSFKVNQSIEGKKLTINGHEFGEGIATHANSETVYDIGAKFKSFHAGVGLDDESLCSEGVSVQVITDGNVVAETPVFKAGSLHTLTANIEGAKKFALKATAKGSIDCGHVDFVNPVLIP
jgi:hypothetical protein